MTRFTPLKIYVNFYLTKCNYIPSQNICIEVNSTWTDKLHDGNIIL